MKCENCGASADSKNAVCPYCGSPVIPDRKLSKQEEDYLKAFIQGLEDKLAVSKDRYDWINALIFLGGAFLTVASYFFFGNALGCSVFERIIFTLLSGLTFFIIFGFFVTNLENKALDRVYGNELKTTIDGYLDEMNIFRYDFDRIANNTLPKKARLRRFLYKINKDANRSA